MCSKLIVTYTCRNKKLLACLTFTSQQWLWSTHRAFQVKKLPCRNLPYGRLTALRYYSQRFTFYYTVQYLIKHNVSVFSILGRYCNLYFRSNRGLYSALLCVPLRYGNAASCFPLFFSFDRY